MGREKKNSMGREKKQLAQMISYQNQPRIDGGGGLAMCLSQALAL